MNVALLLNWFLIHEHSTILTFYTRGEIYINYTPIYVSKKTLLCS